MLVLKNKTGDSSPADLQVLQIHLTSLLKNSKNVLIQYFSGNYTIRFCGGYKIMNNNFLFK